MSDVPGSFSGRSDHSAAAGRPVVGNDTAASPFSSSTLKDFEILGEIGRGGMSIVYEARQISLRRKVALKRMPAAAVFDERWLERFQNEVRTAAQLNHSNIVPFFEAGHDDNTFYYAMQLVDGISLAEVIDRLRQCRDSVDDSTRPCAQATTCDGHAALLRLCERCKCPRAGFPCRAASDSVHVSSLPGNARDMTSGDDYHAAVARMMLDAARALDYAHEQHVLHLDMKPSNLLMDRDGKVWVTDFGASCSSSASDSSAAAGRVGTLRYMSPEQLLGRSQEIDRRSDVFSLGATLFELLTLQRPFGEESHHGYSANSLDTSIHRSRAPGQVYSQIPPALAVIVQRATARVPNQRYATAGELADDLQQFLDGKPTHTPTPARLRRSIAWSSRHRRCVGTIASLVLIVLIVTLARHLVFDARPQSPRAEGNRSEEPGQTATSPSEAQRASLLGSDDQNALAEEDDLALSLLKQGRLTEAEQLYRETWDVARRAHGEEHLQTIQVGLGLSRLLRDQGEYEKAERIDRQNLAAARKSLAREHTVRGEAAIALSLTLRALQRTDEAETVDKDELAAIFAKEESAADQELLAACFLDKGDLAQAEQWGRVALDMKRQILSQDPPISVATTLAQLAAILVAQDQCQEAEGLLRECLAIRREALTEEHWLVAETESLLGDCLARQGFYAEAEPLLIHGASSGSLSGSAVAPRHIDMLQRIVDLYDRSNKPEEAASWREQLENALRTLLTKQRAALPRSPTSASGKGDRPEAWLTCALARQQRRNTFKVCETESRLGACLAEQGRVDESRPLLYGSHAALSALWMREGPTPSEHLRRVLRQSLDRIAWFHQRRGESELADAWRALQVIELDRADSDHAQHAVTSWENICRLYPHEPNHAMRLGIVYQCLAKGVERDEPEQALAWYAKAEEVLLNVLRIESDDRVAADRLRQCYVERARLRQKRGQLSECFADYERALEIRQGESALWREAAWAMADAPDPAMRNLERATALARQVTERDAKCPKAWRILGSVQYRAGQWPEALESLNKAIETSDDGGDPAEHLFLAMTHWQLGAPQEARDRYHDALDRLSGSKDVPAYLVRYRNEAAKLLGIVHRESGKKLP